jgi:hypothetical protein
MVQTTTTTGTSTNSPRHVLTGEPPIEIVVPLLVLADTLVPGNVPLLEVGPMDWGCAGKRSVCAFVREEIILWSCSVV